MKDSDPKIWLHKLFNSQYFDSWLIISYLHRYPSPGIHAYLLSKLSSQYFPDLLPQLVFIFKNEFSYPLFHFLGNCGFEAYFLVQGSGIDDIIIGKYKRRRNRIGNGGQYCKIDHISLTNKKNFNFENEIIYNENIIDDTKNLQNEDKVNKYDKKSKNLDAENIKLDTKYSLVYKKKRFNLNYRSFPCPLIQNTKFSPNLHSILLSMISSTCIFNSSLKNKLMNYSSLFTNSRSRINKKLQTNVNSNPKLILNSNEGNLNVYNLKYSKYKNNNLLLPTINFYKNISMIPKKLSFLPKHLRNKGLEIELSILNFKLDNIKINNKSVLRILTEFCWVLDSAENCPFFVVIELGLKSKFDSSKCDNCNGYCIYDNFGNDSNCFVCNCDACINLSEINSNDLENQLDTLILEKKDIDLIEKNDNDLIEKNDVDTCETNSNDTFEKNESDTSEKNMAVASEMINLVDTNEKNICDRCEKNDNSSIEKNNGDTSKKIESDTSEKNKADASNMTNLVDKSNSGCNTEIQTNDNDESEVKTISDQTPIENYENKKINSEIKNIIDNQLNENIKDAVCSHEKCIESNIHKEMIVNNKDKLNNLDINDSSTNNKQNTKEYESNNKKFDGDIDKNIEINKTDKNIEMNKRECSKELVRKEKKAIKNAAFLLNQLCDLQKSGNLPVDEINIIKENIFKSLEQVRIKSYDGLVQCKTMSLKTINLSNNSLVFSNEINSNISILSNNSQSSNYSAKSDCVLGPNSMVKTNNKNENIKEGHVYNKNLHNLKDWEAKSIFFRNNSPNKDNMGYELFAAIIKRSNDLKQEVLALQIIKEMINIFKQENLQIFLKHYKIFIIDDKTAMIEAVTNTESIHSIKRRYKTLKSFFALYENEDAKENFLNSLVGYSLAQFLLQIKDRHNGNILLDEKGNLIHIDFGFILGNHPGFYNVERAPFKISSDYLEILDLCAFKAKFMEGFLALRKNADRMVRILEVNFPKKVGLFKARLKLELSDYEVHKYIEEIIAWSLKSVGSGLYDSYQYFSHGYMK